METIKIKFGDDKIAMGFDPAQASAPITVDDVPTGYQTADACHLTDEAVLLVAQLAWPEECWPTREEMRAGGSTDAWDALSYEAE